MILIGYDGSPDAQAAIEQTGGLMRGRPVTVVTAWEPFADVVTRIGTGMPMAAADYNEVDRSAEEAGRRRAEEGVARAREAGLKAHARVEARHGSIAESILSTPMTREPRRSSSARGA